MTTKHQDYLFNSRRKRLARIVRFGGEANKVISRPRNTIPSQKDSYPYYGLSDESRSEIKGYVVWLFMILPLVVLLAVFLNPWLGIPTVLLAIGTIGLFVWRKHSDN